MVEPKTKGYGCRHKKNSNLLSGLRKDLRPFLAHNLFLEEYTPPYDHMWGRTTIMSAGAFCLNTLSLANTYFALIAP